jgi:hypothetical protein
MRLVEEESKKRNPSPQHGIRLVAEESKKIPHLAASRRDSFTPKSPKRGPNSYCVTNLSPHRGIRLVEEKCKNEMLRRIAA